MTTSADRQRPDARSGFNPSAPWSDYPSRNPGDSVLSYWRLIQIGAYPAAAAGYNPAALRAAGVANLSEALARQRTTAAAVKPRIVSSRRVGRGRVVAVEGQTSGGAVSTYSFIMRRAAGQWLISYDSLIGDSLQTVIAASEEVRGAGSATPSRAAIRIASQRVAKFRQAVLVSLQESPQRPRGPGLDRRTSTAKPAPAAAAPAPAAPAPAPAAPTRPSG